MRRRVISWMKFSLLYQKISPLRFAQTTTGVAAIRYPGQLLGSFAGRDLLQLWRRDLIGWFDSPAHDFGFGSFQVAAIRTGGDPACGRLVPALFTFVSRRGRVAHRAGPARRSRHGVAMGPALCARIAAVLTSPPEAHQ